MGPTDTALEAVRTAVEPAVRALGLDVYDVEIVGPAQGRTLRLTVTRPGGVDLDAITAVTQAVSPVVDAADAISGSYLLEVSSPGIERVLRRPEHFAGAIGADVSVKYQDAGGVGRVRGVLVGADAERIVVEVAGADHDMQGHEIQLRDITQARTVFEWGPPPRPGKAATRTRAKEGR